MNMSRHDADLYLVGRDHAGAVRTEQQRVPALHPVSRADHVAHRDTFRDANDEVETGVDRLVDRRSGKRRRYIDYRNGGAARLLGFLDGCIDRNALEILACLFRVDACDKGAPAVAVLATRARVELPSLAGDALGNNFCILVDEDAHLSFPTYLSPQRRPSLRPRPCCSR